MIRSFSKESQDLFVLSVTDRKHEGTYVEIGSAWPMKHNNTFILENEYNWSGISIDYSEDFVSQFNKVRTNPCILANAEDLDYSQLFDSYNLGPKIDYLQIDIDPTPINLHVLKKIDLTQYCFSVVMFEHNQYLGFEKERLESRELLSNFGYTLVVADVMSGSKKFEDWYVHEGQIGNDNWLRFVGESIVMNKDDIQPSTMSIFKSLLGE